MDFNTVTMTCIEDNYQVVLGYPIIMNEVAPECRQDVVPRGRFIEQREDILMWYRKGAPGQIIVEVFSVVDTARQVGYTRRLVHID